MAPERNDLPIKISPEDISRPSEPTDPGRTVPQPHSPPYQPADRRPPSWVNILLFLATCGTTFYIGRSLGSPEHALRNGLEYAGAVMLILLAHEMGHFIQIRRYHVPASWPYFIPIPNLFGTMGAVIVQQRQAGDRKALFDIAITGPLAGLAVALPVTWFALQDVQTAVPPERAMLYGDPLILRWMYAIQHGPLPPGEEMILTPLLFAGWVGIFITALNLIPIGQLDGGHMLYALLRRKSWPVATALLAGAAIYSILAQEMAYIFMILLLFLMGPRHPPTGNDDVPLGRFRIALGWLTLAFIIIGFTPTPIILPEAGM